MSDAPPWTWTLRKGSEPNTVELVMRDTWGWTITGVATRQPDNSYAGTAIVGDKGLLGDFPGLDKPLDGERP
jgi:hypothetical protein